MNELTKFIKKNQRTLGIIALIIFALGVFTKSQGINIPFFSGSIIGGFQTGAITIGVIIAIIGIFLTSFDKPLVGWTFIIGGGLIAGGSLLTAITSFLGVISKPMIAILFGIIFLFLIFRKKR